MTLEPSVSRDSVPNPGVSVLAAGSPVPVPRTASTTTKIVTTNRIGIA